MITLEPIGGLGNRMRVLDSGIAMSRYTGSELHVVWTIRNQMPCRFEDLFEVPAAFTSLRQMRDPRFLRWLRLRRARAAYPRFIDIPEARQRVAAGESFVALAQAPGLMIRTYDRFFPNATPYTDLVPAPPIRQALERYRELLPRMVGVHIRRQDNRQSIAISPTEQFLRKMRAELELEPATEFFLATDDRREEALLRREFGARVHTHPKKSVRRGDRRSARDAVVDLYCLAGCRKLLGSFYSTFTETAAALRGIPLEIVSVRSDGV
jgi:hypothetical protein